MGFLSNLYNSAKKGVPTGLGAVSGVLNRLGNSDIISRIGGYVSAASPYISKGLETAGLVFGNPELSALGVGSGLAMDYIGNQMSEYGPQMQQTSKDYAGKLDGYKKSMNDMG
jgi:hypothetical protein